MSHLRTIQICLIGLILIAVAGCLKKGADDPFISLRSRTARIARDWILKEYKKNGVDLDLTGTYCEWNIRDDGMGMPAIDQTEEGAIFGCKSRETHTGLWSFADNGKSLVINYFSGNTTFSIDRLSHKDLWLIRTDGAISYTYCFSPK